MRLIDKDKLLEQVAKYAPDSYGIVANVANRIAIKEIELKMVGIVYCKDCKYYHKAEPTKGDISNISYCTIEDYDFINFPNEDDFCSRGERKTDATD